MAAEICGNDEDNTFSDIVRVRNVSEINTEYNTNTQKKRKLPNWLNTSEQQQDVLSDNKRLRTGDIATCSSINPTSTHNLNDEEDVTNKENITLDNSNEISRTTDNSNETMGNIGDDTQPSLNRPEYATSSGSEMNLSNTVKSEDENLPSFPSNSTTDQDQKPIISNLVLPLPIKVEIKEETNDEPTSSSATGNTLNAKTIINHKVKEEPSSTTRESCKYGIRCYRRNPQHRNEEAHPGDTDYRRPNYPAPPIGTPDCPFGDLCYRRNPSHFTDFSHPPSTDFKMNRLKRLRDRKTKISPVECDNDENEYDLNDDFIDDGSSDEFSPNDDDDSDEDE